MSDEQPTAPRPRPTMRPSTPDAPANIKDILKASNFAALDAINHARQVTGRPRQVYNAALLGVCIVFLAALLAVPRLDTALQAALFAFVVAIPLLALAALSSAIEFKPRMSKLNEAAAAGFQLAGWLIGEGIGTLAVFVGITAVVAHLNGLAAIVGWGTLVAAFLAFLAVQSTYVALRALREYRQRQGAAGDAPTDETPRP